MEQARKYLGVTERNNKSFSDKVFEQKLRSVGWRAGQNWCAYFVSLILNETQNKYIKVRSGLARSFVLRNSIPAKRVLQGEKVQKDWLVVWQRGTSIFGHIGFVIQQNSRNNFYTIEGNVDNAVKTKTRKIEPLNYFRITHFTRTK